jgi:hypothetical protein
LERYRVSATIAKRDDIFVERAAFVTQHIAGMEWVGTNLSAAARITAYCAEMMKAFQITALALPVSDRIIYELELAQSTEIGNWKYGAEHTLQTCILPLLGKKIHLQKALI